MIGLFDGEFAIFDDYLVYEVKYFVFLIVCQANYLIFGYTPVCTLDDLSCFFL